MSLQVVRTLLDKVRAPARSQVASAEQQQFSNPVQLLVHTALLGSDTDCDVLPYGEFVRLATQAHIYHPLVRIAAWIHYAHERVRQPVPKLDSLRQLHVVDQGACSSAAPLF